MLLPQGRAALTSVFPEPFYNYLSSCRYPSELMESTPILVEIVDKLQLGSCQLRIVSESIQFLSDGSEDVRDQGKIHGEHEWTLERIEAAYSKCIDSLIKQKVEIEKLREEAVDILKLPGWVEMFCFPQTPARRTIELLVLGFCADNLKNNGSFQSNTIRHWHNGF